MRLHLFVTIFIAVWLSLAGIIGLVCVASMVVVRPFQPMLLTPLGAFFVVYGMVIVAFKTESKKSKQHLKELFEAEMTDH